MVPFPCRFRQFVRRTWEISRSFPDSQFRETRLVKRVSTDFSRFPGFTGPGQKAALIGIFPVEESDADLANVRP